MSLRIRSHAELEVYKIAFETAMTVFEASRRLPIEERYSLTDQIRRSSRSVCANLAEAWRKRRYKKHFMSKLSDSEAEAAETQVWLQFAVKCGYLPAKEMRTIYRSYDRILGLIVGMIHKPDVWLLPSPTGKTKKKPPPSKRASE